MKFLPRFQRDVFDENLKLVKEVEQLAAKKGSTPAQIALAWVRAHSGRDGLPVIIPIPGATTEERINENMTEVTLSKDDMVAIDEILKRTTILGGRYHDAAMAFCEL